MSLLLNCYVLGDHPDRIFAVKVLTTDNVSILKSLIKKEKAPHLDHVAASDLDLWKVDLNLDNFKEGFENFKPDSHPILRPQKSLSMFKDVIDDHLHVIVKVPMVRTVAALDQLLSLNCFIHGDDPERMFTVKVPTTDNVSILKSLIKKEKAPHLDHVAASDLDLWKVDFLINDLATKNLLTDGPKLGSGALLLDVFPSELNIRFIHVYVYVPVRKVVDEGKEGRRDQISALEKRYQTTCTRILNAIPPSHCG